MHVRIRAPNQSDYAKQVASWTEMCVKSQPRGHPHKSGENHMKFLSNRLFHLMLISSAFIFLSNVYAEEPRNILEEYLRFDRFSQTFLSKQEKRYCDPWHYNTPSKDDIAKMLAALHGYALGQQVRFITTKKQEEIFDKLYRSIRDGRIIFDNLVPLPIDFFDDNRETFRLAKIYSYWAQRALLGGIDKTEIQELLDCKGLRLPDQYPNYFVFRRGIAGERISHFEFPEETTRGNEDVWLDDKAATSGLSLPSNHAQGVAGEYVPGSGSPPVGYSDCVCRSDDGRNGTCKANGCIEPPRFGGTCFWECADQQGNWVKIRGRDGMILK